MYFSCGGDNCVRPQKPSGRFEKQDHKKVWQRSKNQRRRKNQSLLRKHPHKTYRQKTNLQVVAINRRELLFWLTFAYIVSYIYVLIPEGKYVRQYAIFHDSEYTLQGYVYYFCERVRWIIHATLFYALVPEYRYYLRLFFFFACASLVDFCLFLNDPLAKFTLGSFVINGHIFPIGHTGSMQAVNGIGISGPLIIGVWMIYLTGKDYVRGATSR